MLCLIYKEESRPIYEGEFQNINYIIKFIFFLSALSFLDN
jgi:hypothetical protein